MTKENNDTYELFSVRSNNEIEEAKGVKEDNTEESGQQQGLFTVEELKENNSSAKEESKNNSSEGKDSALEVEEVIKAEKDKEILRKLSEMDSDQLEEYMLKIQSSKKSESTFVPKKSKNLVFISIIAIVGIVLSITAAYFVKLYTNRAPNQISSAKAIAGQLQVLNSNVVAYGGDTIKDANIKNQALASGGSITTPPGIIFGNGVSPRDDVLDIYIDFSSQKSRDFILYSESTLRGFVESGLTKVVIHPILSGNFGNYAAEALMEVVSVDPDKAWNFMLDALKLSANWSSNPPEDKDVAPGLVKIAENDGIKLYEDDINSGLFISWLLSVKSDPNLMVDGGFNLPLVYFDGNKVDLSTTMDPSELKSIVTGESPSYFDDYSSDDTTVEPDN